MPIDARVTRGFRFEVDSFGNHFASDADVAVFEMDTVFGVAVYRLRIGSMDIEEEGVGFFVPNGMGRES